MIGPDDNIFPANVIQVMKARAKFIDDDLAIFGRPLRNTDPQQSLGIFASMWDGNDDSLEMRGNPVPRTEPTLQRYNGTIQAFVRDADEERGLNTHSVLAKRVRAMLYRDDSLRLGLAGLTATASGSTERLKRWGIAYQRYLSNELNGSWLFLSNLEFWIETETV